ncbi:hypothetical protein MMC16_001719 [Acarospora aff. strigata]|nr:hypothetical protein [Acarospora aff. strigata]
MQDLNNTNDSAKHESAIGTFIIRQSYWPLPGSVKSYKESGTPRDSGMFTTTLVTLAEEGAKSIIGSATAINYKDNKEGLK